jgi:hypothetical protein
MEKYTPPTTGETVSIVYITDGTIENGIVLSYDDASCHHARFVGRLGQRQIANLFGPDNVGLPVSSLASRVAAPGRVTNLVSFTHNGFGSRTTCSVLFDFEAQPSKSYRVRFSHDKNKCYVQVGRLDDILGPEVPEPSARTTSNLNCKFDKFMRQ